MAWSIAWIAVGTTGVAVGAILASRGWERRSAGPPRWIANIQIVLGTLLVAIGGLGATYGWNSLTLELNKSSMIRSVAAEWLMNASIVNDSKFLEDDEQELSRFVVFPRLETASLEGAVSSGLFLSEADRTFFTQARGLLELSADFNRRLDFTEQRMGDHPTEIKRFRVKLRDGATRRQILCKLSKFGDLLMSDYEVRESDRFFVELDECR
jgi:hypothetical protein